MFKVYLKDEIYMGGDAEKWDLLYQGATYFLAISCVADNFNQHGAHWDIDADMFHLMRRTYQIRLQTDRSVVVVATLVLCCTPPKAEFPNTQNNPL